MDVGSGQHVSGEASPPVVIAVVVTWNGKEDTLNCIKSLTRSDYNGSRFNVILVDNGSADNTVEEVGKAYPQVLTIRFEKNQGYVKAVNVGLKKAREMGCDYCWVLNNDVVVEEDCLKNLVSVAEHVPETGVVGPVIYSGSSKDIDHSGYKINNYTGSLKKLAYGRDVFRTDSVRYEEVDSILGCSNLIKKTALDKVGTFNTVYGLYFEETDLNHRMRDAGFKVVLARDARVHHVNASTMDKFVLERAYLLLRNLLIYQLLNAKKHQLVFFIPYYFLVHTPMFFIKGLSYTLRLWLGGGKKKR